MTKCVRCLLQGPSCYRCRSCSAFSATDPVGGRQFASPKAVAHLEALASQALPERLEVEFYGGEALQHWATIKDLIGRVVAPNIAWKVRSDGRLLSSEHVEFLNEHHVNFVLMNDGQRLKTRFLKETIDVRLLKQIRLKTVEFLVTPVTQDLYQVYDDYRAAMETEDWRFVPMIPVNPSERAEKLLKFDFERWTETVERLCAKASEQILKQRTSALQSWESLLVASAIGDCLNPVPDAPFLRRNGSCLMTHLDLAGNVSLCERLELARMKVFTTTENKAEFEGAFFGYTVSRHLLCESCPVFSYCRGQCPVEDVSQAPQQCHLLQILYRSINQTHKELFAQDPLALRDALLPHLSPEFRAAHGFLEIVPERAPKGSAA